MLEVVIRIRATMAPLVRPLPTMDTTAHVHVKNRKFCLKLFNLEKINQFFVILYLLKLAIRA